MRAEEKDRLLGIGISLGIHVVLFVVVALTGLFVMVQAPTEERREIDVTVYDAEAGGGGGGSTDTSSAAATEPAGEAISYPVMNQQEAAKLPTITESYTKTPEKQQEFRRTHQSQPKESASSKAEGKTSASTGTAGTTGNSEGSGKEAGTGAGTGGGSGIGDGGGEGAGVGKGQGAGRDEAAARRPKTPPQLIASASPRYPRDLEEQGIGGSVTLSLLVTGDGSVSEVSVTGSSGYRAMDAAAVKAAYRYRFSPARNVYDEPVACRITKRIIFQP